MSRSFSSLLKKKWKQGKFLSVGLDPFLDKIPSHLIKNNSLEQAIFKFNKAIVDSTHDLVLAFKPQMAHYEVLGDKGWRILKKTVEYINQTYPDIPLILDAKRGDIGSTNAEYARAILENLGFDALTVQCYFGKEALEPFLSYKNKGIIIVVRTSNSGAAELQDLRISGKPLYQIVAKKIAQSWNYNQNCGVVVGATYPKELKIVRSLIGNIPILIPGIGAQGGDLESSVKFGLTKNGEGIIIHSSRAIIYASSSKDFAAAAREKATEFDQQIRAAINDK